MKDYNSIVNKASLGLSEVSDMLKNRYFEKRLGMEKREKISKVGESIGANVELRSLQKKEYDSILNNSRAKELFDVPSLQDYYNNNKKFTIKGTDVSVGLDDVNQYLIFDKLGKGADLSKLFEKFEITE